MAGISLNPYLFFSGNAREAMEFYEAVFGGKLTIQTIREASDFPGKDQMNPNHVMHAELKAGDIRLFASDSGKASAKAAKIELSLSGKDKTKLRSYWNGLSKGGKVNMPLEKAPWGDTFGMLLEANPADR
jgi:PhnB protein